MKTNVDVYRLYGFKARERSTTGAQRLPQWIERPEGKAGLSWAAAAPLAASRPRPWEHWSWLGALAAPFLWDILFSQILKPPAG